jgi:hypothetical protein
LKTARPQEHPSFGNSFEKTRATESPALSEETGQSQTTEAAKAEGETKEES